MFCRNCGSRLPESAKFCNRCGSAVFEEETPYEAEELNGPEYPDEEPDGHEDYTQEEETDRGGIPKGVVILFICLAAAAVLAAIFFLLIQPRLKNNRESQPDTETEQADSESAGTVDGRVKSWKSGNIDDLAGVMTPAQAAQLAEKEALEEELKEAYPEFFEDEEEESDTEDARLLKLLLEYTEISVEIEKDPEFPAEGEMTITGPDCAAILEDMDFREIEDEEKLFEALKEALEDEDYEERETTVPVTFLEEDGVVYAEQNEEAVRALYGGLIELNEEEYAALFEAIYEEVNGQ